MSFCQRGARPLPSGMQSTPRSSLCVEGLSRSVPAGRSEVGVPRLSWGSPPREGARARCRRPLGTGQRGEKPAGGSSWGAEPFRQNPPLSFYRWLGVTSRFISLSPLLPVSPSASHEENPAWLIPLAAQVVARVGLGERRETLASSRALQMLHVKPTGKANLLLVQKS